MKQKSTLLLFISIALSLFSGMELSAQSTRDTNVLHDPMIMKPGYKSPKAAAAIVTINDYDNFKLGVDFAECSVVGNPMNPSTFYAVWNATGSAGGKGYRTTDGYDWTVSNPSWTGMWGDVVVTSDSLGNLAYQNMYGSGSIQGAKVAISPNFGGTWNSPVVSISGFDKNWMASDQTGGPYANFIYGTMTKTGGGNHVRSTDKGVSWTTTASLPTQALPGMMVAVGPKDGVSGGATYVVTNGGSTFSPVYYFYESNDGGSTYTLNSQQSFAGYVGSNVNSRHAIQNMRTRPYPFIAADNSFGPHRGRLYLVYASNNPPGNGNKPDIYCRYSDNGGTTWSNATVVNDDINSQNNHNWFPAVWCDKTNGRLYVSWMDTRDTPTSDSAMMYASYSNDGVTWQANQKLSNKKMKINCTSCGGGGSPMYLGDYNGVASNGKVSLMAWTDFRDNNFGSYVAYYPDFAMKVSPAIDTASPLATYYMQVPSVKSYTDTIVVSASVSGILGAFNISYPEGEKLTTFPGQIPINISATGLATEGEYTVTVVAAGLNGTPIHKRTALIRVLPATAPLADFYASDSTGCTGTGINFYDLSTGPASQWSWSFPGGTPSTSNAQNPSSIIYNTAGVYDVSLTVTNSMGNNSITKTGFITIDETPEVPESSDVSACFGKPVPDFTATGTNIKWFYNNAVVGYGPTYATGQTEIGEYRYEVTQSNTSCESLRRVVILNISQAPEAEFFEIDPVCVDAPVFTLTQGFPVGGTYFGPGVVNGGLDFDPSLAGAGVHELGYILTNDYDCADTAYQSLQVHALPEITFGELPSSCINSLPDTLVALPEGGTFSGTGVTGNIFDPVAAGQGTFDITYSYTDPNTGCFNSAMQQITVNTFPVFNLADTSTCGMHTITLDAYMANGESYVWMPGDIHTAELEVDTIGYGLGEQIYTIMITDFNGCANTDTVSVSFFDCTGIDDLNTVGTAEILPNPGNGSFTLRTAKLKRGLYTLYVVNNLQQIVYTRKDLFLASKNELNFDLSHLASGNYILKLAGSNQVITKQLIIQK